MKLIYCKETQTIRTIPENYCVMSAHTFGEGGSVDAAIVDVESLMCLMAKAPDLLDLCRDMFAGIENGLTSDEFFKIREQYRKVIQE